MILLLFTDVSKILSCDFLLLFSLLQDMCHSIIYCKNYVYFVIVMISIFYFKLTWYVNKINFYNNFYLWFFLPSSGYNYTIISCKLLIIVDFFLHFLLLLVVFFYFKQFYMWFIFFYFVLFQDMCQINSIIFNSCVYIVIILIFII